MIDIRTGKLLRGRIARRLLGAVRGWIEMHKERLLQMWENREVPGAITRVD